MNLKLVIDIIAAIAERISHPLLCGLCVVHSYCFSFEWTPIKNVRNTRNTQKKRISKWRERMKIAKIAATNKYSQTCTQKIDALCIYM